MEEEEYIRLNRPIVRRFRGDETLSREQRLEKLKDRIRNGKLNSNQDTVIIDDPATQEQFLQNRRLEKLELEILEHQRRYEEEQKQFIASLHLEESKLREERRREEEREREETEKREKREREQRDSRDYYNENQNNKRHKSYLYVNGEIVEAPDINSSSKRASKGNSKKACKKKSVRASKKKSKKASKKKSVRASKKDSKKKSVRASKKDSKKKSVRASKKDSKKKSR